MLKKLLSVVIITTVILSGLPSVARAESVSDKKANLIKGQCQSIKLSIRKLQTNDALVRVSLGRNYEYVLTKLMTNMNSRLALNHKDAGDLLSITARFNENFGYFKKNYIIYDEQVNKVLNADCSGNPRGFYKELERARRDRFEVRFNYAKLKEILEEYMKELNSVAGKF